MKPESSSTSNSLIQSLHMDDPGYVIERDIKIKKLEKKFKIGLRDFFFVPIMVAIANLIIWMCFTFPANFDLDQASLTSFYMGSIFVSVAWMVLICLDHLLKSLPFIVVSFVIRAHTKKVSKTVFDRIIVFQQTSEEVSLALTLLFALLAYKSIFITYKDVYNRALALLGAKVQKSSYEILLEQAKGVVFSKIMVSLGWISFLVLPGEIFTAAQRIKFHGSNLDRRVFDWNETFTIIKVLNRYTAANMNRKAELSDAQWDHFSSKGMNKEQIEQMSGEIVKRYSSNGEYITLEDLTPLKREFKDSGVIGFVKEDEADIAYRLLDRDNDGRLTQFDIKEIIENILERKPKLQNCISVNNTLLSKLKLIVFLPSFGVGILVAMVILLDKGSSWTSHVGSFMIGLSSITRQCMTRLIDVMVFVFSEHSFDIHDKVYVDKKELEVLDVSMFSTIFRKKNGGIVYMPNNILRTTNIVNADRSSSQRDNFFLSLTAPLQMGSLCELKEAINDEMRLNYNNFIGSKIRRIDNSLLKLDMNWEVSTFDEYKGIERSSRKRRKEIHERLKGIVKSMEIEDLEVLLHNN